MSARFTVDSAGLTFDAREQATPIDGVAVVRPPRFSLVDAAASRPVGALVLLVDRATQRLHPFVTRDAALRGARTLSAGRGWYLRGWRRGSVPADIVLSPIETPIPDADLQEARP